MENFIFCAVANCSLQISLISKKEKKKHHVRSGRKEMFCKKAFLKISRMQKHLCQEFLSNNIVVIQTIKSRDSSTGVFFQILRNFLRIPFLTTPPGDCFMYLPLIFEKHFRTTSFIEYIRKTAYFMNKLQDFSQHILANSVNTKRRLSNQIYPATSS